VLLHRIELFRWVPLPLRDLPRDPKRTAGAVGLGGVTGVLLVRQVGVIFDRTRCLYDINPAAAFALGQLGSPGSGIQGSREVDVGCLLSLAVVGRKSGFDQVPRY
jgi:hypothetical protein